jgi:hypothetical protein
MTSGEYKTWSNHTDAKPLTAEQWEDAFRRSREMAIHLRSVPTVYVMTTLSLQAIKDHYSKTPQGISRSSDYKDALIPAIYGIPIEHYATLRECFDRMIAAGEGERLQLVMSDNEMTVDLIGHPYMAKKRDAVSRVLDEI